MHLRILPSHTTFHWIIDSSLCATSVEISCTDFKANGSVPDSVYHDFWSLGQSLHLPFDDVASVFDGKHKILLENSPVEGSIILPMPEINIYFQFEFDREWGFLGLGLHSDAQLHV